MNETSKDVLLGAYVLAPCHAGDPTALRLRDGRQQHHRDQLYAALL